MDPLARSRARGPSGNARDRCPGGTQRGCRSRSSPSLALGPELALLAGRVMASGVDRTRATTFASEASGFAERVDDGGELEAPASLLSRPLPGEVAQSGSAMRGFVP